MNLIQLLQESHDLRQKQKALYESGRLAAECVKDSENPRHQVTLMWCMVLGMIMNFEDKEWEAICKAAAEPCGADGCTCHIEASEFIDSLTKERDIAMTRVSEIEKENEIHSRKDFNFES